MDAARRWARDQLPTPGGQRDLQEEAREREHCGISKEEWEAAFDWEDAGDRAGPAPQGPALVWRVNWPMLELFLRCSTQWVLQPWGGLRGLDYQGVDVVIRRSARQFPDGDAAFATLQRMETAVLQEVRRG